MAAIKNKKDFVIIMFRGKEISPTETIVRVKRILNRCGIIVKETWFDSKIKNIYSVRIEVEGTNYGTNGKGSSKEYALASAFGELIERIGNGALFKMGERQLTKSSFAYFPDEQIIDIDILKNQTNNPIIYYAIKELDDDYCVAFERWVSSIDSHNVFCVKYKSEISKDNQIVPTNLLKIYGSNGMAAGNTRDEAFVQAVSEIFERYSLNAIINGKISPPIIPQEYIEKNYAKIHTIIMEIQSHNDLFVELRDCSLNLGFPVVCA